jgi:hypothetical protein
MTRSPGVKSRAAAGVARNARPAMLAAVSSRAVLKRLAVRLVGWDGMKILLEVRVERAPGCIIL